MIAADRYQPNARWTVHAIQMQELTMRTDATWFVPSLRKSCPAGKTYWIDHDQDGLRPGMRWRRTRTRSLFTMRRTRRASLCDIFPPCLAWEVRTYNDTNG